MVLTSRTTRTLQFGLLGLLLTCGCSFKPSNVYVLIDNGGSRPLVVQVDGQQAATIPSGEFATLSYPPGEYQFRITSGDEVLCDLPRQLVKSDHFLAVRKYLFNPDKNNRYQTYQAQYGSNRLEGVLQTSLVCYQKDPQLRRQYIYRQLLKEIKLLPGDAWSDVSGINYVLTPPPDQVMAKRTALRTVLARLDERSYGRFKQMEQIENPSEEDAIALAELIQKILAQVRDNS